MQTNRLNSVALIALLVLGSTRFSLSNQRITKRADDPWFLEKSAWPQMPYDFGYEIRDLEGNEQYRNERHDGHRVTGSYGYFGPDGIYRHVDYVADERGFRAQIRTSEPGVSNQNPANVKMIVEPLLPQRVPPPGGRIHRPLGGTGGFDPTVLGDPVLESGLTIPPVRDGPIAISNTVDTGRTSSTAHHSSGLGSSQPLPPSGPSDIGSRSPLSSLEPGSPPPPSSSSSGNKLPGGRPLPRPIEIDPLRSRLPGRNPALQLPGGRPSGGSSSSSSGSLGGPIDDLFSGRDPHLSRPARPSTTRPSEYLPELSERDRSLDREMAGYPNQHSATKGGRLPVTYQHDFAKRVDTKQSSGAMEEADTSTNSKADENSTKTSGADSQPSTRESSEPDRSNGRRSDSTSGASNSEMGSTKTSPRPTEPIQPMMKMYFTEGTAAAAAVNSNSDLKSSNRLDSDNAKHSNSNEGSGAEVERIVSGSVGGIKEGMPEASNKERKSFGPGDAQVNNLRFDEATDRPSKYRSRAFAARINRAYVAPLSGSRSSIPSLGRRMFARNYQQYRALRNRVPRDRPNDSGEPSRLFEARPYARLATEPSLVASLAAPSSVAPTVTLSASSASASSLNNKDETFRDRLLGSTVVTKRFGLIHLNQPSLASNSSQNLSNEDKNAKLPSSTLSIDQAERQPQPQPTTTTTSAPSVQVTSSTTLAPITSTMASTDTGIAKTKDSSESTIAEETGDDKIDLASELHPAFLPYYSPDLPPMNEFTSNLHE